MATTISKNLTGGVLGENIDQSGVNTYAERLAAALPGNRVLIDTQTASTSASLDFANAAIGDGTFDNIEVIGHNIVPVTDAQGFEMLVSDDTGATYETTAAYYGGGSEVDEGAGETLFAVGNGGTSAVLTGSGVSNVAAEGGVNFHMVCMDMSNASTYFSFHMVGSFVRNTPGMVSFRCGGKYAVANNYDGLQFKFGGNMASGTIAVYGIKK